MLFPDVGVTVEDVVEVVAVLELVELVPLVAVQPGDPLAGQFQGAEPVVSGAADRPDGRGQLHLVVGGQGLAALEFLDLVAVLQDRAPAARSGITRTGAIGVDGDAAHAAAGRS